MSRNDHNDNIQDEQSNPKVLNMPEQFRLGFGESLR